MNLIQHRIVAVDDVGARFEFTLSDQAGAAVTLRLMRALADTILGMQSVFLGQMGYLVESRVEERITTDTGWLTV